MTTPAAPSGEATSGNRLDALLPCPNGHDFAFSNVDADDPDSTSEPTFGVYCNCGWCVMGFHTQQEAINAWNSRATPTPKSPNVAITDAMVQHMVNRFLGWRLPKPWNPDNGISYARPNYAHPPADHDWPVGTNLFSATEAEAMVRYMIDGMSPAALAASQGAAQVTEQKGETNA